MNPNHPLVDADATVILKDQDATIILNKQYRPILGKAADSCKLNGSADGGRTSLTPCPLPLTVGLMDRLRNLLRLPSFRRNAEIRGSFSAQDHDSPIGREKTASKLARRGPSPSSAKKKYLISVSEDTGKLESVIILYHTLDFHEGKQFVENIKSVPCQKGHKWIFDLTKLAYCDSTTLGIIMMGHAVIKHFGGLDALHIRENSFVHGIIRQCNFDRLLPTDFG